MAATARPRKVGQEESVGILYSDSDTSIGDPRFARFRGISLIWVNFAFRSRQTQGEIGKALWPPRGNRLAQRIEMRHAALVGYGYLAVHDHRRQPGNSQAAEWLAE